MAGISQPFARGARACAGLLGTLVLWTSWLALLLLLAAQAYVATVNELPVPRFVLNMIQARLAESGVGVHIGRATFDPSGRVLLRDAELHLAAFPEPAVTARAIFVRVDPWAFLAGPFAPSAPTSTSRRCCRPPAGSSR
jgi:hypothetical protein